LSRSEISGCLEWRKASRSVGDGECIEVAPLAGHVAVRDSKDPGGTVLLYSIGEWRFFLVGTKCGVLGSVHQ
jgi:hypothetical protein